MNTSELESQQMLLSKNRLLKKQKLIELADSVLNNPKYKDHFENLLNSLKLNYTSIIDGFLDYNLDVYSRTENEIYSSLTNRAVLHIHNLITDSWHIERQKVIYDLVQQSSAKKIADIGFGVPSLYIQKIISQDKTIEISLCDLYQAAFDFAIKLLPLWNQDWSQKVSFVKTDMDELDFIGPFDLYIFQDSIEHTIDPTSLLKKYVALSPPKSKFILSLPIGPIIPGHYLSWETNLEAKKWLNNCGLDILSYKNVFVNLAVDLFAEDLGADFNNYMVLCRKF